MRYSKDDFKALHANLETIINLVNENVTGRKPRCMQYIEKMYHNIGVCIAYGYKDMGEVRKLIVSDWEIANDRHNGIGRYYFEKADKESERRLNNALEVAIMTIDTIING